jgi:hypothetical protein
MSSFEPVATSSQEADLPITAQPLNVHLAISDPEVIPLHFVGQGVIADRLQVRPNL